MKYILSLIMFFSISSYAIAESVHLEAEVIENEYELFWIHQAMFAVKFKAEFQSGKTLSDIVLSQSTLSKRWMLRIDTNFENAPSNKKSISINEYESLISSILEYISNSENLGIDYIQVNYRLIDSVWEAAVNAVKESVKSRTGKISSVRGIAKATGHAVAVVLQESGIFDITCSLLNKYFSKVSYTCEVPAIHTTEGTMFQHEYFNKTWKDITESEDGGLDPSAQFGIHILQNGVDMWSKPVR